MFGFIIFVIVLSAVVKLFTRPFRGLYRPWYGPFSSFGWWMRHHHHHHHHHHHGCHHHGYWHHL